MRCVICAQLDMNSAKTMAMAAGWPQVNTGAKKSQMHFGANYLFPPICKGSNLEQVDRLHEASV